MKKKGARGRRSRHLHVAFRGFVKGENTKPDHERYLQAPPGVARAINAALTSR